MCDPAGFSWTSCLSSNSTDTYLNILSGPATNSSINRLYVQVRSQIVARSRGLNSNDYSTKSNSPFGFGVIRSVARGGYRPGLPLWNFHADLDKTVPVSRSRDRMPARRKAGGHPLYTEYVGVDHSVWQWAFTEPALPEWLFAQRRG
jgi:hypothetical protein